MPNQGESAASDAMETKERRSCLDKSTINVHMYSKISNQ